MPGPAVPAPADFCAVRDLIACRLRPPDRAFDPLSTPGLPEPNGYLHIGHVQTHRASTSVHCVNGPMALCNLRLDDTNPTRETEYVDAIDEDVRWLIAGGPIDVGSQTPEPDPAPSATPEG